jgi:hypothetical protein
MFLASREQDSEEQVSEQAKCGDCGIPRAHPSGLVAGGGKPICCSGFEWSSRGQDDACAERTVARLRAIVAADADLLAAGERLRDAVEFAVRASKFSAAERAIFEALGKPCVDFDTAKSKRSAIE